MQVIISQIVTHSFLFINSGSGGGLGRKLVSTDIDKIVFTMPQQNNPDQFYLAHVYFVNMRKQVMRENALRSLKKLSDNKEKIRVIVCGGDGTIMWVAELLAKHSIDPMLVPIGVVALGTGNDFSRYLGWGGQQKAFTEHTFSGLKQLIREWILSQQQQFDIWNITAQPYENGFFEKVDNQENLKLGVKKYSKNFCNYFSFGLDGKIGYSFDKHRTQSRSGNYLMYGVLGMIKSMTKTKQISELVSEMKEVKQIKDAPPNKKEEKDKEMSFSLIDPHKSENSLTKLDQNNKTIFKSNIQEGRIINNSEQLFKKTYYNLLALNIDSFMGGTNDIWQTAKVGINQDANYTPQSSSDGKLQFVSFRSGIGMIAQKLISGWSQKIAQGQGPFSIDFHQYPNENKHRTYLQIDGEFVRFTNPKNITIQKSNLFNNGKMKVLRKKLQSYN